MSGRAGRTRGLRALLDRRLLGRTFSLPRGVRLEDGALVDTHVGTSSPANATAQFILEQIAKRGLSIDDVAESLTAQYSSAPARQDCLDLVRELNGVGLLNARPRGAAPVMPWGRAAQTVVDHAYRGWDAAIRFTLVRRAAADGPGRFGRVFLAASAVVAPMVGLLVAAVVLAVAAAGFPTPWLPIILSSGVVVLSVAGHEVAHAEFLAHRPMVYLASLGWFRVLGSADRPRRTALAALAGPVAGALVALVGVMVAAAAGEPFAVLAAGVVALSHASCLSPWSADGRALRANLAAADGPASHPLDAPMPDPRQ